MKSFVVRPVAAAFAVLGAVSQLGAQSSAKPAPGLFELFAARHESHMSPLFGGLNIGGFSGVLGFRLGGSFHFGDDIAQQDPTVVSVDEGFCGRRRCRGGPGVGYYQGSSNFFGVSAWTADVDLLVEPLRETPVLRSLFLGFSPYGFVGIGGYGASALGYSDTSRATWSYGVGLRHQLIGNMAVEAEARTRRSLSDNEELASSLRQATEYRLGVSFAFGGPNSSPRRARGPMPPPRRPRVPTCGGDACGPAPAPMSDDAATRLAARLLDVADGYVDTRYRAGGTSPGEGFDAAGFVQFVFEKESIRLPRTVRDLARTGYSVSPRVGTLRPGDLLFFANDGTTPDHVAIYAGRERIIHATASGDGVRYDVLGEGARGQWFAEHLVSARRVIGGEAGGGPRFEPLPPDRDARDRPDGAPAPSAH